MTKEEKSETIKLLNQHYNGLNTLKDSFALLKLLCKRQSELSEDNYDLDEQVTFNTAILAVVVDILGKLSKK